MKLIRLSSALCILQLAATLACAKPVHLRCELLENPLGIDATTPRLSWQSDNVERDWHQTAYEILVATRPELLKSGSADVWDTGKVDSSESVGVVYAGPKLQSRQRYYWTVRTWDGHSQASTDATPAWWEMGLLTPNDWSANWISSKAPDGLPIQQDMHWIWPAEQDALHVAPETTAVFRLRFDFTQKSTRATLFLLARGTYELKINGRELSSKSRWTSFDRQDIADQLTAGENELEVTLVTPKSSGNDPANATTLGRPAGIVGLLKITNTDGATVQFPTNEKWEARPSN